MNKRDVDLMTAAADGAMVAIHKAGHRAKAHPATFVASVVGLVARRYIEGMRQVSPDTPEAAEMFVTLAAYMAYAMRGRPEDLHALFRDAIERANEIPVDEDDPLRNVPPAGH